jgi:hypothetical protein
MRAGKPVYPTLPPILGMADRQTYEPVLSSKSAGFLVALSQARQRKLIGLLYQLAENPSQIGDYSEPDDTGREIQFILVRDLLVAFWADHAIRELRIVDIEEV